MDGNNIERYSIIILIFAQAFILSGCVYNQVTINPSYQTRNIEEFSGILEIGEFTYNRRPHIKDNEIYNTSINRLFIETSIPEFLRTALGDELALSGVNVLSNSDCSLAGSIENLDMQSLGLDIDFSLSVSYLLSKNDSPLYSRDIDTKLNASKSGGVYSLNQTFFMNFNELLTDQNFVGNLEANCI